jgi:site-specific DNA-cytosine methylase
MSQQIKVLSLFSGYGGAEFALQKAGVFTEIFKQMFKNGK